MQLDNGTVYLLYENSGGFTDNFGNYGNSHCYGKIKTKEEVALNFKLFVKPLTKTETSFGVNLLGQKQRWLQELVQL